MINSRPSFSQPIQYKYPTPTNRISRTQTPSKTNNNCVQSFQF